MNVDGHRDTAQAQLDLLRRAGLGDGAAAASLADTLGRRAFAQAYRMLGHTADAEDVTQEALLRLWRAAPDWDDRGAQPSTWLYRVVANLCIDRMRRGGRSVPLPQDGVSDPRDPRPSADRHLQDKARSQALYDALDTLPDRQRHAVVLRHLEGLGNPEIAAILEVSVEAVESLTARGRRALAAQLARQHAELGFDDDQT